MKSVSPPPLGRGRRPGFCQKTAESVIKIGSTSGSKNIACSRASILDYLMKLKQELDMTIVFITHDIGLAYYVSDRIFIMHQGRIVEQGSPDDVTQRPTDPATRQLLDDIPDVHKDWIERNPAA